MNMTALLEILRGDSLDFALYFTRKTRQEYISYSPEVGVGIFDILLDNVVRYIEPYISFEQVAFNPTGHIDSTIEICDLDYVGNYDEVVNSFDAGNIEDEDVSKEVENLTFYCLDITNGTDDIKLFRRVTKFKRLYSKGLLAAFQGNRLNRMDHKILGLDGNVDLIVYNGQVAILSHVSLERIFRLGEQFSQKAAEAIGHLRASERIINFDAFEEDCLNDLRIQRALTRMLGDGNLRNCFSNFDNIVETINIFELDIEIQNHPTQGIIYEDKSQLMEILRFARDSYYRSLVREEYGIDEIK